MTRRGTLFGAAAAVSGVTTGSLLHPAVAEAASIDGYINVKDEGAVGNGSTDDTTAFQTAINAAASLSGGGVVYVPATSASYRISQIRLKANVWLLGNGARSVLRSVDNNPNTYMVILDSATARDVWITDLQLTCTKQNQSLGNPGGVLFDQTGQTGDHRHHFERLFINNFKRDGLHFAGAARTLFIRDSYIGSCDGHGMVFDSEATDNVIEG